MQARSAVPEHAEAIARIYNEGIADRLATFETRLRTAADTRTWFGARHPVVVVEEAGEVLAFAATSEYRPRQCYAGVVLGVCGPRRALGFRVVGTYQKHGRLDGAWRDVVIVERLLP